ncbi:MAG: ribonuclease HI [Coriobacteriaceae bacterium]|nr:ribonuclease HI [Coriobacteriaceae bacterium]
MTRLEIYCDGGCRGNQAEKNVGGWGAYLVWGEHEKELFGGERNTTNNKMELMGAIEGLRAIKNKNVPVDVYVDSAYVLNGITQWIFGWMKKGWVNSKKEPVANKELWQELLVQKNMFPDITFHKVKGHSTNAGNNKADELANRAMDLVLAGKL